MRVDKNDSLRSILGLEQPASHARKKFDLNLLPIFIEIYQHKSVSKAALILNMTQSSVSLALGKLRDYFDDPLFFREGQHLTPTQAAAQFYASISVSFGCVHREITKVAEDKVKSKIIIHASPYLSMRLLPSLSEFIWLMQNGCEILHKSTTPAIDSKETWATDVMPDITFGFARSTNPQMNSQKLMSEPLCFVCSEHHPRLTHELTSENGKHETFVTFERLCNTFLQNRAKPDTAVAERISSMKSDSLFALLSVIGSSDKISVIPVWLFEKFNATFHLKTLATEIQLNPLTVYMIYSNTAIKTPVVGDIISQWAGEVSTCE